MIKEVIESMEAGLAKTNDRKRSSWENCGVSTNSDSFSMARIEMQDNIFEANESQTSVMGTLETGKDAARIFSEVRSSRKKKTKFRKRTEQQQLDSSENSDQSQTDNLPEEVGIANTDQMSTISTLTLSDEGSSGEKSDLLNGNITNDVSLAIIKTPVSQLGKKLLVLDLNGLLADIVYPPPKDYTADAHIAGRAIFKRPFCDDFLRFCFGKFEVGIWSSRNRKNVERFIDFLMGDMKRKLLFCWPHTAIFPHSFKFGMNDNSLGAGGDLRVYLERLASAENLQNFLEQNQFGQIAITEGSNDWDFYSQFINTGIPTELQSNVGLPA
ncbi:hypothetical protein REPUB_Repub10bG0060600 [Reevesia pubescens]